MNSNWKMFFLVLLIASITMQGYSIYVYATVENTKSGAMFRYRVLALDYIADDCWNLTDPDQYILDAIEHPQNWSKPFYYKDSSFWFIAPWYDHYNLTLYNISGRRPKPFLYNGTCYDYDAKPEGDIAEYPFPKPPKPEYTAIGLAGMWAIVGSVYVVKNRKTKTEP